jgi:hypothetical protein
VAARKRPTNKLHELAARIEQVPGRAITKATDEVVAIANAEARRATGDGRMSGLGRRGAKLRGVAKVKRRARKLATAEVSGVPAGGWAILQSGAVRHVITPQVKGGVLVGRSMRHPVSGPVEHPGMAGKRSWEKVLREANRKVPEVVEIELEKALR